MNTKILSDLSVITQNISELGVASTTDKSIANLIGLLIDIIKQQQVEIDDLKKKVSDMCRG